MSASPTLTSLKLSFNGEIRRLSVSTKGLTYQDLMAKTLSVFPNLTSIQFSWVDDENDKVLISSSEELSEALRVMAAENKGYLRFEVLATTPTSKPEATTSKEIPNVSANTPKTTPKSNSGTSASTTENSSPVFGTITHAGVQCDVCGVMPLTGSRFKCAVRDDYDLCEACEARAPPPHPMVKIYHPDQVPAGIMVMVGVGNSRRNRHSMCGRAGVPNPGSACHRGIVCDGCNIRNFHGPRFKCSVRHDYDLCEACEAKDSHSHVMVKIYPQHANLDIQVVPSLIDEAAMNFAERLFGKGLFGGAPHGPPHRGLMVMALMVLLDTGLMVTPMVDPLDMVLIMALMVTALMVLIMALMVTALMVTALMVTALMVLLVMALLDMVATAVPLRMLFAEGTGTDVAGAVAHAADLIAGDRGTSVARDAADRAKQHAAAMEEQQRLHKAKEDSRLEDELLEMCIQESLAEKARLATVESAASSNDDEVHIAERNRLRKLAFEKYGDAAENDSSVVDMDTSASNEEKGEPIVQEKTSMLQTQDSLVVSDEPPVPPTPPAKLMCRFVRDVTMPDGSEVAPYSTFFKTWRVRNDGTRDWPEGCHLVSAGGDRMCDTKLGDDYVIRQPVPATVAGEEVEITVELCAPSATGRHVGYFRLQNPEGSFFGQRLWADIRVNDADMAVSMTLSPWEVIDTNGDDDVEEHTSDQDENQSRDEVQRDNDEVTESQVEPEPLKSTLITETEREQLLEETDIEPPSEQNTAAQELAREQQKLFDEEVAMWAKELRVLSAMGFNDLEQLLPLLREHIKVPASEDLDGAPGSEVGLQTVVLALLSGQ
eukprot:CAMPEP_0114412608 /NCGR_PEP_ID=MMETSP0103-20121206/417_1 /TAXON_ID=37642 ORGANISM="Paraphysomonas imperforata, Strain PA2" /NCGR_SAMPLE_ID=MMETSP0103 /ASSEMBLY_ACC=CAM_ASM_000201 /LENGTH=827 /DNA_ID=CAMNT_0001580637 /DNA_START=46 /DNA_END=2529 /DNA_ORIENTATION=-